MGSSMLSRKANEMIMISLESFINAHSSLAIINGESIKRYKKGIKGIEKLIEKLDKGKCNSKMFKLDTLELMADGLEDDARRLEHNI